MSIIFPIDPARDAQGRLLALCTVLKPEECVPVPMPAIDGSWDFEFNSRVGATSVFAKLGVSSNFAAQTTVNSTSVIWDGFIGKRAVLDAPTPESVIFSTFWGVGLRVELTFSSAEITSDANASVVAAHAEFHAVDVQYGVHAIGLGAAELALVLRKIPPLGRFDLTAYTLIDSVRGVLKDAILARLPKSGDPAPIFQPVLVELSASPFSDDLERAAAYRFAMICINAGLSLASALSYRANSAWRDLDADLVTAIFRKLVGSDGAPAEAMKAAANQWLAC